MDESPEDRGKARTVSDVLGALHKRRVFIETYGCRYNFGDTAKLVEILKNNGSTIVDAAEEAEAIVINTCTVVGPTERRMLRRLSYFRDEDLYVTGCMPAVQRDAIFSVCTPTIISPEMIHEEYRKIRTVAAKGAGIVQIAQGCLGQCTYCLTRFARGPLRSFSPKEILEQVIAFDRAGTPEIQLTAQDVSAWGRDSGQSLPELLESVNSLPGQFMIRVGMMNPATVNAILDDLIEAFAGDHIFKFIHLPVQSGSDRVLERMARGYRIADFENIVAAFRKRYPEITLMTDMIVGFYGESPENFSGSVELINRVKPNKVNVTRYSRRPFTPMFPEKDLPDSVKKDRSRVMNYSSEQVYASINCDKLGQRVPFVVTETIRKGSVLARSPEYLGVVINECLPVGFRGHALLKKDRKYFFIGERVD